MNHQSETFYYKAPHIMEVLMKRYYLSDFQAAGIVGNLGRECGGFTELREIGQPANRGGYGWAQWTGPRRADFLNFCEQNHLDWYSDEGNQGFLFLELDREYYSAIIHVKCTGDAHGAATAFEKFYERAGVVAMADRWAWADRALSAYKATHKEGE